MVYPLFTHRKYSLHFPERPSRTHTCIYRDWEFVGPEAKFGKPKNSTRGLALDSPKQNFLSKLYWIYLQILDYIGVFRAKPQHELIQLKTSLHNLNVN